MLLIALLKQRAMLYDGSQQFDRFVFKLGDVHYVYDDALVRPSVA